MMTNEMHIEKLEVTACGPRARLSRRGLLDLVFLFVGALALALFAKNGIPVKLQGAGFVSSQVPPGAALRRGEVPTLILSESAPSVARAAGGREETSSTPFRP